jgi:L-alanine-DL-glutamate epimerase-like enolase superfamily enzyme
MMKKNNRKLSMSIERWPTMQPFRISGITFDAAKVLVVSIEQEGAIGRGEATGVYYLNETAETIAHQVDHIRYLIEKGASRQELQRLLPSGGARNAIDCALWDLQAKLSGQSIFELTGIDAREIITVNTIGIDTPDEMAAMAKDLDTPKIKVKLDAEQPLERMQAIRQARPDAELVVDINQGWNFQQLVALAPEFKALGVTMIEQPLPRGKDKELEGYQSPVPLCADESCLDTSELEQAASRYQMINIKLDKTGGLTEALTLAKKAKEKGLALMVGNMLGTSLAMAPGFVVAQYCQLSDLDGPVLLREDRREGMMFDDGKVSIPERTLWG